MQKLLTRKIVWVGLLISIVSVLANLLFFALTQALGEQYIIPLTESSTNSGPMPVFMVILATLTSALLATMLYSFLSKIAPNATMPPFLSVAGTALLVSFGGPLDLPGAVMQTKLLLSTMHIIAAIIIIGGLLIFHWQKKKTLVKE
jgi:hypothetical protein